MRLSALIQKLGAAVFLCGLSASMVRAATGGAQATIEQVDTSPCLAAIASDDVEKAVSVCSGVIDNEKATKPDRLKVLIARGAFFARHDQIDPAIADYTRALQLEPSAADLFNARGELWFRKGDRPKAVQDFGAALRLDPNHEKARANQKAMARELERIGAQMAIAGKPSFNCTRARRAVEKAICADPELADLDREIFVANARAIREAHDASTARALRREQDDFVVRRAAEFGHTGYDLKKVMQERLRHLGGANGY